MKRLALGLLVAVLLGLGGLAAWGHHAGYRVYVVHTGSMVPTFSPGDAVVDRPVSAGLRVGQPVTVALGPETLVTHRLQSIDRRGLLHTKGDANRTADAWALPTEHVRGVVTGVVPRLGYAIVFLHQRNGVFGVMTSALALILLWGICFPAESRTAAEAKVTPGPVGLRIPTQRLPVGAVQPAVVVRRMPPTPPPTTWQGRPVPAVRTIPTQRGS